MQQYQSIIDDEEEGLKRMTDNLEKKLLHLDKEYDTLERQRSEIKDTASRFNLLFFGWGPVCREAERQSAQAAKQANREERARVQNFLNSLDPKDMNLKALEEISIIIEKC